MLQHARRRALTPIIDRLLGQIPVLGERGARDDLGRQGRPLAFWQERCGKADDDEDRCHGRHDAPNATRKELAERSAASPLALIDQEAADQEAG